jgi:hypothetical protein
MTHCGEDDKGLTVRPINTLEKAKNTALTPKIQCIAIHEYLHIMPLTCQLLLLLLSTLVTQTTTACWMHLCSSM